MPLWSPIGGKKLEKERERERDFSLWAFERVRSER